MFGEPKCQTCHRHIAQWAWQPCGPDDNIRAAFTFLGEHYRGFQVVKVCDECKDRIKSGNHVEWRYHNESWWYDGQRVANMSMCVYH